MEDKKNNNTHTHTRSSNNTQSDEPFDGLDCCSTWETVPKWPAGLRGRRPTPMTLDRPEMPRSAPFTRFCPERPRVAVTTSGVFRLGSSKAGKSWQPGSPALLPDGITPPGSCLAPPSTSPLSKALWVCCAPGILRRGCSGKLVSTRPFKVRQLEGSVGRRLLSCRESAGSPRAPATAGVARLLAGQGAPAALQRWLKKRRARDRRSPYERSRIAPSPASEERRLQRDWLFPEASSHHRLQPSQEPGRYFRTASHLPNPVAPILRLSR